MCLNVFKDGLAIFVRLVLFETAQSLAIITLPARPPQRPPATEVHRLRPFRPMEATSWRLGLLESYRVLESEGSEVGGSEWIVAICCILRTV